MADPTQAQSRADVINSVRRIRGSVESYAHRAAKEVFAGWLRAAASDACGGRTECTGNPTASFGGLIWRVNRDGPNYGVWTEYPIGKAGRGGPGCRDGLDPVWDEDGPWEDAPPAYDELVALGRAPEFIFDVAVQHKGVIIAAFEIVHKNPPHDRKITAAFQADIRLCTVPAKWVLGQVARPDHIPGEFWMWDPR